MEFPVRVDLTKIVIVSAFLLGILVWRLRGTEQVVGNYNKIGKIISSGYVSRKLQKYRYAYLLVLMFRVLELSLFALITFNLFSYFSDIEILANPNEVIDYHLSRITWKSAEEKVGRLIEYSFWLTVLCISDALFYWVYIPASDVPLIENSEKYKHEFEVPDKWRSSPDGLWAYRNESTNTSYSDSEWSRSWPHWLELVNKYRTQKKDELSE